MTISRENWRLFTLQNPEYFPYGTTRNKIYPFFAKKIILNIKNKNKLAFNN